MRLIMFIFGWFLTFGNEVNQSTYLEVIPTFELRYMDGSSIKIDGIMQDSIWNKAKKIYLRSPWNNKELQIGYFTAFRDSHFFYFAFKIVDSTINIYTASDNEMIVAQGDRVELFFSKSLKLDDYFCFEISPAGKVLDYRAEFYRKLDYKWNLPNLIIGTHIEDSYYVVEGKIPIEFLKKLLTYNSKDMRSELYIGIFTADFHSKDQKDVVWNSWVMPKSKHPDFHIPSAFGELIFNKLN